MSPLLRLRVLLPLAALCVCGCLSVDAPLPTAKVEDAQDAVLRKESAKQNKTTPCYEDDQRFAPFIQRDVWDHKKNLLYSHLPMDYIVVRDGGKGCSTNAECLASVSGELREGAPEECRPVDNFYVGGNGEVYEGRGWLMAPYWHLNGMRRHAVTVKFLGPHEAEGPSEAALRAFWRLAKAGVWERRLSRGYSVVSMGQVYGDSSLVGKALEAVFRESSVGMKEFSLVNTWETTPDKSLPLITREEWGAKKPTKTMVNIEYGLKYVMINEGGERCFTPEECISRMKAEQAEQLPLYGDLIDNFYIGDDGYVYEGRGLDVKPLWDTEIETDGNKFFKDESITVRFFGNFQSDAPSEKAIGALKLLVNAGVSIHRIPDGYKIFSLRGVYHEPRFLGDAFLQIARKWHRWAHELEAKFEKELESGEGFIGMVKRIDWDAKDPTKEFEKVKHPVDYVIINQYSASDRCLSSKDCIALMKEIQEKDLDGYGDVKDNFYVSNSGNVYEGRGWNAEPQFQPKYFNESLITVNFLGNHQGEGPSLTAIAAFDKLMRVGEKLGKLSPNYEFYSSRNIYDAANLLGDGLKKHFVDKKKWSKKLDALSEEGRFESGLLPIVPISDWWRESGRTTHQSITHPVQYVVVSSSGDRCFTTKECEEVMKESKSKGLSNENGPLDNFYVGDDGLAYEGRGWTFAPSLYAKGFQSEFFSVTFLRNFNEEGPPSHLSILAFNRLLENGLRTQKLSPEFKIVSIHQIFDIKSASEDKLYKVIQNWERWDPEFDVLPGGDARQSGDTLFVRREDWFAEKPVHSLPIPTHPVGYVLVRNVGDHCIDMTSCIRSVQKIQKNTPPKDWDVADNFFVGDDGHIYEGRGWDNSSFWAVKGIDNKFISVGFLGSFETEQPSPKALLALHILQQTGIAMGKLSPDFKTLSLGELLPGTVVTSEKLIEALNNTVHWSEDGGLGYDKARLRSLNSSFILSDEWNLSDLAIRKSSEMSKPLKYLAIRDGGESCNTYEACLKRIRKEHEDRHKSSDGGVAENFYIGNDGSVFEGAGWDWDMSWGFTGWQKTVSVQFFGTYGHSLPSEKAIEAFNSVIIKDGIETGKLMQDYNIVPIPEGEGRSIGAKLRETILTWKNGVPEILNS